ncbi:hypothetical protein ACFV19_22715 [Streptomyces griseoluteus]|uniref:hypothetical protein n=1 Tax=Streptomyces griseoluteus TaxID=29306 RepID=UPI00369E6079
MVASAAASSSWLDYLKFLPGWLAFAWAVLNGLWRWWVRRHRLAIGQEAEEVREALTRIRTLFGEIVAQKGCNSAWFADASRREAALPIKDAAARVEDRELKSYLLVVAHTWGMVAKLAPPGRARVSIAGMPDPPGVRKQRAEDQKRLKEQVTSARGAGLSVQGALDRLNKLERRTFGR